MPDQTLEQAAKALAAKYYNAAGVISCQFVIKLKRMTPEGQALVNVELMALGLPPYDVNNPKKKSSSAKARKIVADNSVPKELDTTGQQRERELVATMTEIQIDKGIINEFFSDLRSAEDLCQQQLCELRGVPYTGPIDDPFAQIYKAAHNHARFNRDEIAESVQCGCFFCRAIFDAKTPMEFVEDNRTALCPNCGIDSVIGDKAGYQITNEFLTAMFRKWFSIPIRLAARKEAMAEEAPVSIPIVEDLGSLQQQFAPQQVDRQAEADRPIELAPELETEVPAGVGAGLLSTLPDEPDEELDSE